MFIEQGLSLLADRGEAWDSGANRVPMFLISSTDGGSSTTLAGNVRFLQCPAHPKRPAPAGPGETDYVGIAGLGVDAATLPAGHPRAGVFGDDRPVRLADIKDRAGQTMMVAETARANGPWTAGGFPTMRGLDPARQPYLGRGQQFGGTHDGGASILFADGSVRFLRQTVEPRSFEALSTIAGGEALGRGWTDE